MKRARRDAAPERPPRRWALEGVPIRYIRTTYLPDDETCFHLFEAVSTDIVEEAGRRAGLVRARVVPAVDVNSSRKGRRPC